MSSTKTMNVVKRDGSKQAFDIEKVRARIDRLMHGLNADFVTSAVLLAKVRAGMMDNVRSTQLDTLAAETAAHLATEHPDWSALAARLAISAMHKTTAASFFGTCERLHSYVNPRLNEASPLISDEVWALCQEHRARIEAAIDYERDFGYAYFGFMTLVRSYLIKIGDDVVERPQHMLMRVALGIHKQDIDRAIESYHLMSQKWFTHASPTLFNAGTRRPQMSSCFLLTMQDDSIIGIYDTLKMCARISQSCGGIGLSIHNVRAADSYIKGTNGTSNGIVPMLRVFDMTARYVDQGGGKRKGSIAIYLEPWHADVFAFLELKKNHGKEEDRARDLFYAMWIPDLFMKRVEQNGEWTLMCPHECPGLPDCYGAEFEALYLRYEREGKGRKAVRAQALWFAMLNAQIETGTPYMLYKDACNRKSNQKNLGTIKSSNLCTEILEYTSKDEVAVCNLASLNLTLFADEAAGTFDFDKLLAVTKVVVRNLNRVIDANFYPVPEARNSNMRHRPVGIGVQGLADCFQKLRLPYESAAARQLNKDIFETIYFGAVTRSMEMAQEDGPYSTYAGSPMSQGLMQWDLWDLTEADLCGRWDWAQLKRDVQAHGVRNSLLVAPMPTASTAQILGNNESFEPYTSNIYNRRVLAGEFTVINQHLLKDLVARGLWTPDIRNQMIADRGSVQNIPEIPADVRALYKTVWEIKQKVVLDLAADRGAFIDQSQSLNIHIAEPNLGKLTSMHFYAWKKGLKTGLYYLRAQPKANAIQFTVDQKALAAKRAKDSTKDGGAGAGAGAAAGKENAAGLKGQALKRAATAPAPPRMLKPEVLDRGEECLNCGS